MPTPTSQRAQVTNLLPNDVLARLERMRINAERRFTNRSRGEHVARRGGSSIEFKDYRDYVEGDDTRFVDWNIFMRLQRPYLKLFHEEEEMHLVLLIDASSSMMFENKFERAQQLAAAFGVCGLMATEKVSIHAFNQRDGRTTQLKPTTGRASMPALFRFIESLEAGGEQPLDAGIESMVNEHRGRGVVVVLSDFLTFGSLRRAFNRLHSTGLELFGLQILGPTEIDPEVSADLRLVDCETAAVLDVSAGGDVISIYREYLERYQRRLEALCQQRVGRFVTVNADWTLKHTLFDVLRRRGWLK